jgi:hypothetical protein
MTVPRMYPKTFCIQREETSVSPKPLVASSALVRLIEELAQTSELASTPQASTHRCLSDWGILRRPELSAQRWKKSDVNRRPLPPRHRIVWITYGLCGRTLYESPSAQPGGGEQQAFRVASGSDGDVNRYAPAATDWVGAEHDERT